MFFMVYYPTVNSTCKDSPLGAYHRLAVKLNYREEQTNGGITHERYFNETIT